MSAFASGGSTWLRCYRPLPSARVRLVCLPHAGGSAAFFRRWPGRLPEDVELHIVQYPGREDRLAEPCVNDLQRLADRIAEALTGLYDRPLALFGHSMGAALGYEVGLRLHRRGLACTHLFVSGFPAPEHHTPGSVHRGDDEALVAELLRLGGTDPEALADPALRELVLPTVRADYRAIETWPPPVEPVPVPSPLTAFAGRSDPEVTVAQMRDWVRWTTGGFALHDYPGGHFFLTEREDEVIAEVARTLTRPVWAELP